MDVILLAARRCYEGRVVSEIVSRSYHARLSRHFLVATDSLTRATADNHFFASISSSIADVHVHSSHIVVTRCRKFMPTNQSPMKDAESIRKLTTWSKQCWTLQVATFAHDHCDRPQSSLKDFLLTIFSSTAYKFQENLLRTMIQIENTYFELAKSCKRNCLVSILVQYTLETRPDLFGSSTDHLWPRRDGCFGLHRTW